MFTARYSHLIFASLIFAAVTVAIPCVTKADAIDDVLAALDKEDYPEAWTLLQPLIQSGNERGLFLAALMTQKGQGMTPDPVKAIVFYKQAAAKGYHPAMNNLGVAYREGRGVEKDFAEAMKWFKKAALAGNSQAALNVGALYVNGQGVESDLVTGFAWYQLSDDPLAKKNAAQLKQDHLTPDEIAKGMELAKSLAREKAKTANAPPAVPGTVPISVQMDAKKQVTIRAVRAQSLAEKAGIKVGDVLVEVENKAVSTLSPEQFGKLMQGDAGTIVHLKITRGGREMQLAFERDPIDAVSQPKTGPDPAKMETHSHPDGLWSIEIPANFTKSDPAPGNLMQSFKHSSGAMVIIAAVPNPPFKTGEKFYQQSVRTGLEKTGAKFEEEEPTNMGGVDGYLGRYTRTRDNVPELGQTFVAVSNETAVILQMLMPEKQAKPLGPTYEKIARSFKFTPKTAKVDNPEPKANPRDAKREENGVFEGRFATKDGTLLISQKITGDSEAMLRNALRALTSRFDSPPRLLTGFVDTTTGQAQCLFDAKRKDKAVEGLIVAVPRREKGPATVAVIYDDAANFAKSRPRLMAQLEKEIPAIAAAAPVQLKETRLPDNSGSVKLPAEWKVIASDKGMMEAHGPNGESVVFGLGLPIAVPSGVGNGPFVLPYMAPEQAIVAMTPSFNFVAQQAGNPTTDNVKVVESKAIEYPGGKGAFMVWRRDEITGQKRTPQTVFGLVITAPVGPGAWMFYASAVIAPDDRFEAAFPAMLQSWKSWKIDDKVFVERLRKAAESMQATTKLIQEATATQEKAFAKSNAAWEVYLTGFQSVVDAKTGKVIQMPLHNNKPLDPQGNPKPPDPNDPKSQPQDLQKWIEEQNRQAGFNRFNAVQPGKDPNG